MADSDIDFCKQQIKIQEGKIQDLMTEELEVEKEILKLQEQKCAMGKSIGAKHVFIQQLKKKIADERCILGQLKHHKRELERIKTWERIQHSSVEQRSKK